MIQLGVNIDHVATVRQARLVDEPDVFQAALEALRGGAYGITIHLREDRRHIQDKDVFALSKHKSIPLNLEMSIAESIVHIALKVKPEKVCLVPEKRKELTTEGGLAVSRQLPKIKTIVSKLSKKGIIVSLFIDPSEREVRAAKKVGAHFIELHTGVYANATTAKKRNLELERIKKASTLAHSLGLGVNAGHGLNYDNVQQLVKKVPYIEELNIGHSIVAQSIFVGMRKAVSEMLTLIKDMENGKTTNIKPAQATV